MRAQTEESEVNEQGSEGEVVTLSAFQVTAADAVGYLATQSLAGTRLNANIRDIGATISIVTKQFLEDTGTTDVNELFVYTSGTETGGDLGNYSNSSAPGGSHMDISSRDYLKAPQFATRVRGLAAPDLTRDYFLTRIPFDSYNTQRIEINRGANSILFGLGSPVGLVNNMLSQPIFGDAKGTGGEVNLRVGERGSVRVSLDVNHELIDEKLAVRIVVLHDRDNFRQQPASENTQRVYGAATFKPFRGSTFRFNAEHGVVDGNRPITIAPGEHLSAWILSGNPINDLRGQWNSAGFPGGNNFRTGLEWMNKPFDQGGIVEPGPSPMPDPPRVLDLGLGAVFSSAEALKPSRVWPPGFWQWQTALTFDYNKSDPIGSIDHLGGTDFPNSSFASGPHPLDTEPDGEDGVEILFWNGVDDPVSIMYGQGFLKPGFNDTRAFNWIDNLITGDSAFQDSDFTAYNVGYEQTFLNNQAGVELVYNTEEMSDFLFMPMQGGRGGIQLDINPVMPVSAGGLLQPNPNYLRPYYRDYVGTTERDDHREAFRVTGFAKIDLAKILDSGFGKVVGRHVVTALYSDQTMASESIPRTARWKDNELLRQSGSGINGIQNAINHFVYVGPAVSPTADSMDDFEIHRFDGVTLYRPGLTNTVTHWDSGVQPGTSNKRANGFSEDGAQVILDIGGADGMGNIHTRQVPYAMIIKGAVFKNTQIESQALILQSHVLHDLVVGTVGWRKDDVTAHELSGGDFVNDSFGEPVLLGRSALDDTDPGSVSDDTLTWSLVGYWPSQISELPFGSTLSGYYTQSSNFQPSVGRINEKGESLPMPGGDTTEFGAVLSMFNDKLYIRVNNYETNLVNAATGLSSFGNAVHLLQRWYGEVAREAEQLCTTTGIVAHCDAQKLSDAAVDFHWGYLPQAVKDTFNLEQLRDQYGKVYGEQHTNPSGLGDTQDMAAKGTEIEFVFNPNENWRIMFNLTRQEAVMSNIRPFSQAWAAWVRSMYDTKIPGYDVIFGEIPAGTEMIEFHPELSGNHRFGTTFGGNPGAERLIDHQELRAFGPLRSKLSQEGAVSQELREWRFNLVLNYGFTEGMLDGLSVGAAYRYQSEVAVGYALTDTTGDGVPDASDVTKPYFDDPENNIDVWVKYRVPGFKKYGDWTVGLLVRNVTTNEEDVITVHKHHNGMVARVRYAPPRSIYFTSKFRF